MTVDEAKRLDAADPLAFARERFRLPEGIIYLDGNSLGPLPAATPLALKRTMEQQWGKDLIASWNKHGWIDWPSNVAAKLAPLVGAEPSELLIADSTSVCLFKLLAAAACARPGAATRSSRKRVISRPTLYVADGVADLLGLELKPVAPDKVLKAINRDTAVVTLTHVDYRSAAIHDMRAINDAAHAADALTVWDLSHTAGALELDLNAAGCDLAVGCGYKYLNGGPGAPAFIFVASKLQDESTLPASRLDGACRALRVRRGVPASSRDYALPDGHAVHSRACSALRRAVHLRRHRHERSSDKVAQALRSSSSMRSRRAAARRSDLHHRATRLRAEATSSSPTRTATPSCRR